MRTVTHHSLLSYFLSRSIFLTSPSSELYSLTPFLSSQDPLPFPPHSLLMFSISDMFSISHTDPPDAALVCFSFSSFSPPIHLDCVLQLELHIHEISWKYDQAELSTWPLKIWPHGYLFDFWWEIKSFGILTKIFKTIQNKNYEISIMLVDLFPSY